MCRPLILVHGYSDSSSSFGKWIKYFKQIFAGVTGFSVHVCDYRTLTNEVTIKDIAEGFDRSLKLQAGLSDNEEFDVVVHSTGMLVIRSWLTIYGKSQRQGRLKHLVALAPATFGSPLAKKGRSWLGAVFKGERKIGPDFMEAGDMVLDVLELASSYTWDLAHKDMLLDSSEPPFYGADSSTPFVFTFCGTETYGFIHDLVTPAEGSDGTVRWAGCTLNTRKITLDLSFDAMNTGMQRIAVTPWTNVDIPFIPVKGLNHGDVIRCPDKYGSDFMEMVRDALLVKDEHSYNKWCLDAMYKTKDVLNTLLPWQQFVIRVVDERGDPVPDYYVQLFISEDGKANKNKLREFSMDVHTYSKDASYRCLHVNLQELSGRAGVADFREIKNLWLRIMSATGTELVGYTGFGADGVLHDQTHANRPGEWDAKIRIPDDLTDESGERVSVFYPFTTTLLSITLNREPFPFKVNMPNKVARIKNIRI